MGVYGPDDPQQNAFMRHDLRDQFSLLWHLVRPGVSLPMPIEPAMLSGGALASPKSWGDIGYLHGVRLVPQEFLLGSYPYVSCSQPGDRAHRCYQGRSATGDVPSDFIVSVPLLGSLPQNIAQALLDRFVLEGLGTLTA